MKKYFLLIIPVLILSGCMKRDSFIISGKINEAQQKKIYVYKIDINTPVLVDTIRTGKSGSFRIRVKASEPDFYQVGYSATDFITLLAEPGEKINLALATKDLTGNYEVTGSKGSSLIRTLDQRLIKTKIRVDSLDNLYKKAVAANPSDTRVTELEQKYYDVVKEQRKYNIAFILQNMNSLAAIKALYQRINDNMYVLYEPRDIQYLKIVSDSLKRHYPNSKHTRALVADFTKENNEFFARSLQRMTDTLPELKLDPVLPDINGKNVVLSSLRGKYVLLAFWSADSRDCITENLQLKEFYKTYSRRGFEIYQINLDQDETKWKAAVKFDELPWISTRENDPSKTRYAVLYNIKSLPANYLYDPSGKIIGTNLHGRMLQIKLDQLFK